MFGFIYITTNNVNGRKYLGFCNYQKKNWKTYLGSGKAFRLAVSKYSRKSFTREIIFECETKEKLSQKEIELISFYNCVESPEWYNIAKGGYATRGFIGKKHSEETKAKMRLNHKQPLTDDSRRRIGEAARKRNPGKPFNLMSGSEHARSVSVIIDGIIYETITEACKETGLSYKEIKKLTGITNKLNLVIDGITYPSIRSAAIAIGRTPYYIKKHYLPSSVIAT